MYLVRVEVFHHEKRELDVRPGKFGNSPGREESRAVQ